MNADGTGQTRLTINQRRQLVASLASRTAAHAYAYTRLPIHLRTPTPTYTPTPTHTPTPTPTRRPTRTPAPTRTYTPTPTPTLTHTPTITPTHTPTPTPTPTYTPTHTPTITPTPTNTPTPTPTPTPTHTPTPTPSSPIVNTHPPDHKADVTTGKPTRWSISVKNPKANPVMEVRVEIKASSAGISLKSDEYTCPLPSNCRTEYKLTGDEEKTTRIDATADRQGDYDIEALIEWNFGNGASRTKTEKLMVNAYDWRVPPTVKLHSNTATIDVNESASIEGTIHNPLANDLAMEGELSVNVESGISISGGQFQSSGLRGFGAPFRAEPSTSPSSITGYISSDKAGKFTLNFIGSYRPSGTKSAPKEVKLTYTLIVNTPTPMPTSTPIGPPINCDGCNPDPRCPPSGISPNATMPLLGLLVASLVVFSNRRRIRIVWEGRNL